MVSLLPILFLLCCSTAFSHVSASPPLTCGTCRDRTNFKLGLVVYLDETDTVKSGDLVAGFLESAKLLRVQPFIFKASPTSGMNPTRDVTQALTTELDNALIAGVNAVVTMLPNLTGVEAKLRELKQNNITVASINTGHTELRQIFDNDGEWNGTNSHLPIVHIGNDEDEEGSEAGRQMALAGGKSMICVLNGYINDISSIRRCEGFARGFLANCRHGAACNVTTLTVNDISNIELVSQEMEEIVQNNEDVNGIVSDKGKVLLRARQLLSKYERISGINFLVGAFGMDAEVQGMLSSRNLTFAVDHQEYFNAFMATTIIGYALSHRQVPASRTLSTRPLFTTEARATERDFDMRDTTMDVIIHGRSTDEFWNDFSVGVAEAANDLQLAYSECKGGDEADDCFNNKPRRLTYYASGIDFDLAAMAQRISRAAAFNPDAMVVSVPSTSSIGDAIGDATRNKNVDLVSVNALPDDDPRDLGILYHFGQDEERAGQRAALGLLAEGATHVLCLNQEAGNDSLSKRCAGLEQALKAANPTNKMTAIFLPPIGSNIQAIRDAIVDTNADAMLVLGPPLLDDAIQARRLENMIIRIALFDMLAYSRAELIKDDSAVLFVVDQQQEMQAYMSVMSVLAYKISGQVFTSGTFETGPVLATKEDAVEAELACGTVPVCSAAQTLNATAECAMPFAKGDGWCDAANNVPECDYDGGDCCASQGNSVLPSQATQDEVGFSSSCMDGALYQCGKDHFGVNLNAFQCVDPRSKCLPINEAFRADLFDPDCTSAIYALDGTAQSAIRVIGSGTICLCLVSIGFYLRYRKSRVIFFANSQLMIGVVTGAALVSTSALLGTLLHTWSICVVRVYTFNLGCTLALMCVLVKCFRLHKIFGNTQLKMVRISNRRLFSAVGVALIFDALLISFWLVTFPAASADLVQAFSKNECLLSSNDVAMTICAGVYLGLLVMLNLYLVLRLERTVPATFLVFVNDVKESARVITHIALLGGFYVALGIGLTSSLERRTWLLLETLASLYFALVSVVMFVFPKWMLIRGDRTERSRAHAYVKTTKSAQHTDEFTSPSPIHGSTFESTKHDFGSSHSMNETRLHSSSSIEESDVVVGLQTKLLRKQALAQEKSVGVKLLANDLNRAQEQLRVLETSIAEIKAELLFQNYTRGEDKIPNTPASGI